MQATDQVARDRTTTGVYASPLGALTIAVGARGVSRVLFPGQTEYCAPAARNVGALGPVVRQLDEYFARERRTFDLPLELVGTEFQRAVWRELCRIPYATTISYSELAHRVGRPDAVRGVGAAVGQTPVPIIVPCHRVVGKDRSLTGYGGGLDRKRALLELERRGDERVPEAGSTLRQLALL